MSVAYAPAAIQGLRVFVVEDETMVVMLLEDLLDSLGCKVVDSAGSVAGALARLDDLAVVADAAILDVNIGGEMVFPVADALAARGVPFLFATGYGTAGVEARYPDRIVLSKPFTVAALADALESLKV